MADDGADFVLGIDPLDEGCDFVLDVIRMLRCDVVPFCAIRCAVIELNLLHAGFRGFIAVNEFPAGIDQSKAWQSSKTMPDTPSFFMKGVVLRV